MTDTVVLGEVAEVVMGQSPPGDACNRLGVGEPLLNGPTEFGRVSPTPAQWTTQASRLAQAGDVLFCVRGSTTGRMNRADQTYAIGRGVAAIRGKRPEDTEFIRAALVAGLPDLLALTTGTVFPNISGSDLRNFELPWPSVRERARVTELLSALDARVATCRELARLTDEYFQCQWQAAFAARQESPTGSLRDFCDAQYGVTASGSEAEYGPRLLRVTDINKRNWVEWRAVPRCEVAPAELAKYSLARKDIVVARMADPGKSAIIDAECEAVFASYLIRIKPRVEDAQYFTFGFLKSPFFVDYADGAASGSVQLNMNAQTILNAPCTLPSSAELKAFESWAEPVRGLLAQAIREHDALLDLQDFLLPRLLSGELQVTEASALVGKGS